MTEKLILFRKGVFIAVRHENGWWLAQLYTHIFKNSEKARIRWFDLVDSKAKAFVIDECNDIPTKSIICEVKVKRVSRNPVKVTIDKEQYDLIDKYLEGCRNPGASKIFDDTDSENERQKPKRSRRSHAVKSRTINKKKKAVSKKTVVKKQLPTGSKRKTTSSKPAAKKPKVSVYASARVYETNPIFDAKVAVPAVAPTVNFWKIIRAVKCKDMKTLEQMIVSHSVPSMGIFYEMDECQLCFLPTPWEIAIKNKDLSLFKKLVFFSIKNKSVKCKMTANMSNVINTGDYNVRSLGIEHVRPITVGRGSREGNNAFRPITSYSYNNYPNIDEVVPIAIRYGCDLDFIRKLVSDIKKTPDNRNACWEPIGSFEDAVRIGNHKLASQIAEETFTKGDKDQFNQLHVEVLKFNGSKALSPFKPVSCHKKTGYDYGRITPLHSVCINPDGLKYLKQMLGVDPLPDIKDNKENQLLHFAAVSKSAECTKYLLSIGGDMNVFNQQKLTPLMLACKVGSVANIKAIMGHAYSEAYKLLSHIDFNPKLKIDVNLVNEVVKDARGGKQIPTVQPNSDEDETNCNNIHSATIKKFGVGDINKAALKGELNGYTPLIFAVEYGHLEAVNTLLALGADPNKALGADKRKKTPLMEAVIHGHLDIAKTLVLHGAKVNTKDRHGLTAFIYAAKTNQLHCLSWLAVHYLKNCDDGDSSGNTALQYASAEGYILVVKYLVEELKSDVTLLNNWGTSALANAVLRQQNGVIEYLLRQPNIDINFRDNQGATMIMRLASAHLSSSMELFQWLLDKGADVTLKDNQENTALHYFCTQGPTNVDNVNNLFESMLTNLVDKGGLDVNAKNKKDKTPIDLAIDTKNVIIMKGLIKRGAKIAHKRFGMHNVVTHYISQLSSNFDHAKIMLEVVRKNITKAEFLKFIEEVDDNGLNGMHITCKAFSNTKLIENVNDYDYQTAKATRSFVWKLMIELLSLPGAKYNVNTPVGRRKLDVKVVCSKNHDKFPGVDGVEHPTCCNLYPYGPDQISRPLDFLLQKCSDDEFNTFISKFNPEIDYNNFRGLTQLHRAVIASSKDRIKQLVSHGASLLRLPGRGFENHPSSSWNQPISVYAAIKELYLVPILMDLGADVFAKDSKGCDTLHYIVKKSNDFTLRIATVERILSLIDNVNTTDNEGNTYLHNAIIGMDGGTDVSIEILSMLLTKGADPNILNKKGIPPLHYAFFNTDANYTFNSHDPIEVVSSLTHRMKSERITAPDNYHGFTPLHLAAMTGGYVTCMHLISKGCQVDLEDNQGNTPLALAVEGKHQSVVLLLIQHHANIDRAVKYPIFKKPPPQNVQQKSEKNEQERYVWLPSLDKPYTNHPPNRFYKNSKLLLYKVINYEWQGVVFALIDILKKPFVPLEAALLQCKFNLAITLMLKYGDTLKKDETNEFTQNLLHILCLVPSSDITLQERVMKIMFKFGFDPHQPDGKFMATPLHYSCLQYKVNLVKLLANSKVINMRDGFDRTPICSLFWNIRNPDRNFLKFLVQDTGASLDVLCDFNIFESGYTTFGKRKLSGKNDYFTSYNHKYSLVGKAVIEENYDTVKNLLDLGANPNIKDSSGRTPLMYAAKLNDTQAAKLILEHAKQKVDVALQCNDGRTALHYAVLSTPGAQLQQNRIAIEILKYSLTCRLADDLLITAVKDRFGKSVLCYCIEKGYDLYINLFNAHYRSPIDTGDNGLVLVDMDTATPNNVNFERDSKLFLEKWMKDNLPQDRSNAADPDSCLSLSADECEVCKDDSGRYFDMLMTKIDLKSQLCEIYNFYKMQIVKNIGKNIYILLTRWGRIGDDGQHQETPFPTLAECKTEFEKVFKAKTKNEWANVDNFQPQKGKYKLISRDRRYKNIYKKVKYDFMPDEESQGLDKAVQKVMEDGSRPSEVSHLMSDFFKLQVANTPYGFIPSAELDKAATILAELKETLQKIDISNSEDTLTFDSNSDEYSNVKNRIWDLSADLYHIIPQRNYSNTKIYPLRKTDISTWGKNIKNLKELELVNYIMAGSQLNPQRIHPLKYVYQSLDCLIEKMPPYSDTAQYLMRNIFVSGVDQKVRGIYQLSRSAEASIQAAAGKQRLLLFHGAKTGALLSILKRGLQHAPYGITHGNLFGDGIYLADSIAKSFRYANSHDSKSSEYVLVVSISMDGIWRYTDKERYRSWKAPEPPKDTKTVWVVGKKYQDFSKTVVLSNGCVIGLGEWQTREYNKQAEAKHKAELEEKERKRLSDQKKNVFQFAVGRSGNNSEDEDEDYAPSDNDSEKDSDEESNDNSGSNTPVEGEKKKVGSKEGFSLYEKTHLYRKVYVSEPYNFYCQNEVRNMMDYSEFVVKDSSMIKLEYLIEFEG